jgi:hypothetical protein
MKWQVNLSDIGGILAVISFVFTQFVEVTLFKIGALPITIGKLVVALIFPFSIMMMGCVCVDIRLILFSFFLSIAYLAAYFVNGSMTPEVLSALLVVIMGLIGAIVLYSAINKIGIKLFAKTWIFFSIVTAIVALLQSLGAFPLLTVPEEHLQYRVALGGLYRGVGFKFDPNFQALMLAIGIVFAQFYSKKGKFFTTTLIFLGIVATFSRMGMLMGILAIVVVPLAQMCEKKQNIMPFFLKMFVRVVIIILIFAVIIQFGPYEARNYLVERIQDVIFTINTVLIKGELDFSDRHPTSAETRIILARTSFELALKHWLFGIGAYQTDRAIYEVSGIRNVAHNTYIELFLIGGIWGIFAMIYYTRILMGKLKNRRLIREYSFLVVLILLFCVAGLFLSLTYNSIMWLPLVLALAAQKRLQKRYSR